MTFESMIENTKVVPTAPAAEDVVLADVAPVDVAPADVAPVDVALAEVVPVDVAPVIIADNASEAVAVKVSYGDDIRRTTFNGGLAGLRTLAATLFALDQANVVLKYQDEDGDKITLSTDGELQETIKLVEDKKILRLFVELNAPVVPPVQADENNLFVPPFGSGRHFMGPHHRGFGGPHHRGPHGSHHAGPHYGHHAGPHGGPHHSAPYHGPHAGPHAFGPHHGPHHGPHAGPHAFGPHHGPHGFAPCPPGYQGPSYYGHFSPAETVYQQTPAATTRVVVSTTVNPGEPSNFTSCHTFGLGQFSPADVVGEHSFHHAHHSHPHPPHSHHGWNQHHPRGAGPYMGRHAHKEHKHATKHYLKSLKANATTPEERLAVKEMKRQMKEEWRASCNDKKWEKKCEKKREKKREKCMKKNKQADEALPSEIPPATEAPTTPTATNDSMETLTNGVADVTVD